MFAGRSWDDWIKQYAQSHQNRWNQLTHSFGIPMIALSLILALLSPFVAGLWQIAAAFFILGWVLQFIGHAIEGKPPEFLSDWRFLLVGTRWWVAKVTGRLK